VAVHLPQVHLRSLAHRNISFDYGPDGRIAQPFKDLAAGNQADNDPNPTSTDVDPQLLSYILGLAANHTINISSLTTGHSPGDVHTIGKAVDINIFDGTHLDGTNAASNALMTAGIPLLPAGSGFGDCDGHQLATNGKSITFFPDNCNHVHTGLPR
jgi:hypothetical protein